MPDWKAIYPFARKAMKSFTDGGRGFETKIGSCHGSLSPAPCWRVSKDVLAATAVWR
jgi:hypothetical protein